MPKGATRQLNTKTVSKFRGISQYSNIMTVPMEHALDLVNVFISMAGHLSKVRLPVDLTGVTTFPLAGQQAIIDTMVDFQQSNGTRQLVFNAGPCIGFYVANVNANGVEIIPYVFNAIEDNVPDDNARWSWVQSNNILYGANGKVMRKWDGAHWYQTGIGTFGVNPPAPAPGAKLAIASIQRVANVVTVRPDVSIPVQTPDAGWYSGQITGAMVNNQLAGSVTIDGATDPTMDGTFAITGGSIAGITYANAGPDAGPFAVGFVTVYYAISDATNLTLISRAAGISTLRAVDLDFNVLPGDLFTISGAAGALASFNGTFKCLTFLGAIPNTITFAQYGLPDVPVAIPLPGVHVKLQNSRILSGRTWRYAYANSVTGLVGPASDPISFPLPGGGLLSNIRAFVTAPSSADPQVDQIWWFGNQDGGGDYGKIYIAPTNPNNPGGVQVMGDGKDDSLIDLTQLAPLINYAPPVGSKLAIFQGRVFLAGIVGNPQDIAYSAYEQVLVGQRPEECWFPSNRLRLAVGADDIRGFGVILPGVVAFSKSDQMFMFKGEVEDITTSLPVNFTAQLEQLPWSTGCVSHASIQSTPYGIVWVGSDMTVKMWNGVFYGDIIGPRDLSANIYPLMRRITPGTASLIQSAFFNWFERDWYGINVCLDGATRPTHMIFFDLAQDAQDNLGVFIVNLPTDCMTVREDNNGVRHLLITTGGVVQELVVSSNETNGVTTNVSATDGSLNAYWTSGYEGIDTPSVVKMFRFGHIITDQGGFGLLTRLVDGENYTFSNPLIKALRQRGSKFSVNRKARFSNITIMFPSDDVTACVQSLDYSSIPVSER